MNEPSLHREIETIRRMIESSRRDRCESGDIYVMWGVIVLIGTVVEVVGVHLEWSHPWLGWLLLGSVGGAYSAVITRRRVASAKVLTYASKIEGFTWLIAAVAIASTAFIAGATGALHHDLITPVLSLIIAVAIGTSGAVYENRWLQASSLGFIATGTVSFFLGRPYPQLLFAAMVVVGYIMPGLAMRRALRADE